MVAFVGSQLLRVAESSYKQTTNKQQTPFLAPFIYSRIVGLLAVPRAQIATPWSTGETCTVCGHPTITHWEYTCTVCGHDYLCVRSTHTKVVQANTPSVEQKINCQ